MSAGIPEDYQARPTYAPGGVNIEALPDGADYKHLLFNNEDGTLHTARPDDTE
ncbi:hypothetical protein [Microbacterium amylolyticum]|uniref:Uncharacterized protein n=1 Tax=Microbacterium amylolyticum TaxID=936337 RepID=A0ABS4ZHD9_9MICO|nr:hypothetical protein [Microbacterium amylolyticum]MBP2435901.1 hypothetical protein [Microbacterium amylolyticum]